MNLKFEPTKESLNDLATTIRPYANGDVDDKDYKEWLSRIMSEEHAYNLLIVLDEIESDIQARKFYNL